MATELQSKRIQALRASALWERKNRAEEMDQLQRDIEQWQEGQEMRDQQTRDTYLEQSCQLGVQEKDLHLLKAICGGQHKMSMQGVRGNGQSQKV